MRVLSINNNRIILNKNPNYKTVSVGVFLNMGSKFEQGEESGISHFIEHMLLTSNLKYHKTSTRQIVEDLGGFINAFTTKEFTCIHGKVISEYSEILVEILIDIIKYPAFKQEDIEREKNVILNEIQSFNNNGMHVCQQKILKNLFKGHPLSNEILGNRDSIRKFNREQLIEYYLETLNREIVICITGDFDEERIIDIINKKDIFNSKKNITPRQFNKVIYSNFNIIKYHSNLGNYISFALPGYSYHEIDTVYLSFLTCILGYGSTSLLNRILRDEMGLIYNLNAYLHTYNEGGALIISTTSNFASNIDRIISIFGEVIERLKNRGLDKKDFDRVHSIIKSQILFKTENPHDIMLELGRNELLGINNNRSIVDYNNLNKTMENLKEITYEYFCDFLKNSLSNLFLITDY